MTSYLFVVEACLQVKPASELLGVIRCIELVCIPGRTNKADAFEENTTFHVRYGFPWDGFKPTHAFGSPCVL